MNQISNKNNNIFTEIKQIIFEARNNLASVVNVELLKVYWQIGRIIVEDEQNHQDRADYGKGLIKQLSKELTKELEEVFSGRICKI